MSFGQELQKVMCKHRPDTICVGSVCFVRLDDEKLVKTKFTSRGGNYDGLQLTVLNRNTGPVDSITIHTWDVPYGIKKTFDCEKEVDLDIYRPSLDIDALWELAEEYLRLFQEPGSEMR